jgi:flagellar biosynthetic protein FliP
MLVSLALRLALALVASVVTAAVTVVGSAALAAPAHAAPGVSAEAGAAVVVLAQAAPAVEDDLDQDQDLELDQDFDEQVDAEPAEPGTPDEGEIDEDGSATINIDLDGNGDSGKPSQAIVIILLLTVMSLAPALLILMTSFTRIVIVLSLTRNALGLQGIPPNQVLVGLAMFLSLFIMGPVLAQVNSDGVQPYLSGEKTQEQAFEDGMKPIRAFMFEQVGEDELALFIQAKGDDRPAEPDDVSTAALVPAFVLSEIKTAFIIGFVIFIPFLVIDIVVSSSLMSMGMMMLPPVLISLPFKLLLFVMVDGWALVVRSILTSYT